MENSQRKLRNPSRQRAICILTDWLTTFVAFFCFDVFRFYYMGIGNDYTDLGDYLFSTKLILEQIFVPLLLLVVYWISGYYNKPFERSRLDEFLYTFYSQLFNAIVIYLAALTNDQLYLRRENWLLILILFLLLFTFVYIGRMCVTASLMKEIRNKEVRQRTAIIGLSNEAFKVASRLQGKDTLPKTDIVAFLPFSNEKEDSLGQTMFPDVPRYDGIDQLLELCNSGNIDQVILAPPPGKSPTKKVLHLLYHLYPYDVTIKINPDILSLITPVIRQENIFEEPLIDLTSPQMSEFSKNVKRAIDVLTAGAGLVLLSPFLAAVAVLVKSSSAGPVFYRQQRSGLHRKPFNIYKFRSMYSDAEKDGVPRLSGDSDPRITPIGRWLRKYRIDELPQFWNVLKGDMSLVGPRPEREYYIEQIVRKAPWYTLVLQAKPGITSWGMVKYGYATDVDQMIERNRFDLVYLSNMSVPVDFKILLHTIKTVFTGKGK